MRADALTGTRALLVASGVHLLLPSTVGVYSGGRLWYILGCKLRGGAVWKLARLITWRSRVRIPPPLPTERTSQPSLGAASGCLVGMGDRMGRPKVNIVKLREWDTSSFLEFEAEVLGAIRREEEARRQERLEAEGGKKKKRRRRR